MATTDHELFCVTYLQHPQGSCPMSLDIVFCTIIPRHLKALEENACAIVGCLRGTHAHQLCLAIKLSSMPEPSLLPAHGGIPLTL